MDTMEIHYAIMAGFMHFSLTGRMGREGEITGRRVERFGTGDRKLKTEEARKKWKCRGRGVKKGRRER